MAGIGYVLGGVAQGLNAGFDRQLQRQKLGADTALGQRRLDLMEKEIAGEESRNLKTTITKHIGDTLKVVSEIVKNAKEAGAPPDKINATIEPLLADVEKWSGQIGLDPSSLRARVQAEIGGPSVSAATGPRVGSTMENLRAKLAAGEKLTPSEQKVYDDARRMSMFDRILLGAEAGAEEEAAPAGAPAPAATSAVPGPTPRSVRTTTVAPEAAGDVSEGPMPLPKTKAELKAGRVYSLPDGRQGLWNGKAFEIL